MIKKLVLLLLLVGCVAKTQEMDLSPSACFENQTCITLEIAKEKGELAKGLMFREKLDKDKGMFFIFPNEGRPGIWMKNVKFPIDIIWLDEDLRVVTFKKGAPPCKSSCSCKCTVYKPGTNSSYVIEVNENFVEENNIEKGQKVVIKNLAAFSN